MGFIKTPDEIIREMNPCSSGSCRYDFSVLYPPKKETGKRKGALEGRIYVTNFAEKTGEDYLDPSLLVSFYGRWIPKEESEAVRIIFNRYLLDKSIPEYLHLKYLRISDNHVTQLNLGGESLSEYPTELENLNNLLYLNLCHNKIKQIPKEIRKLTDLQDFHAEDNNITSLPIEMLNLTNLSFLGISNNPLDTQSKELLGRLGNKGVRVDY